MKSVWMLAVVAVTACGPGAQGKEDDPGSQAKANQLAQQQCQTLANEAACNADTSCHWQPEAQLATWPPQTLSARCVPNSSPGGNTPVSSCAGLAESACTANTACNWSEICLAIYPAQCQATCVDKVPPSNGGGDDCSVSSDGTVSCPSSDGGSSGSGSDPQSVPPSPGNPGGK